MASRFRIRPRSLGASGGASSPLLDDLISYWKLEEASGQVRIDQTGTSNLTDNNTVTATTGIVGNAGSFDRGTGDYLSKGSITTYDFESSYTISAWVKLDTHNTGGASTIVRFYNAGDNNSFRLGVGGDDKIFILATFSDGAKQAVRSTAISFGTWYHVLAEYDSVGDTLEISLDDETPTSTSTSTGTLSSIGTGTLIMGQYNTSLPANGWEGEIDEVGIWNRTLTSQEKTDLAGADVSGLTYPF